MDLYAYSQIKDLGQIAKDNGIDIPRLRGYRLMENETPVSADTIKKRRAAVDVVCGLCASNPL